MTPQARKNSPKKYIQKDPLLPASQSPSQPQTHHPLAEKRILVFLILLAIILIPFSVWQLNRSLSRPFEKLSVNNAKNSNQSSIIDLYNNDNANTPALAVLSDKDTDQDGLNDYDELYVFKTSPYLQDSDSDKINDKLEIDQDTDPNCPTGETCGRVVTNTNSATNATVTDLSSLTPEQLRQIMRDAGAPEDVVSKISDDDLLATYQQILAEEGANLNSAVTNISESNINDNSNLNILDVNSLYGLSAEEIRQLLIEGGVPRETLDAVDDQTLIDIYQESLTQNLEGTTNTNS